MSCESISLQRGVQRDDGGITRALSYIYHIYHSTHYFFRSFYSFSLSLFFRIFLYSFYLYAERGKGNVIFRLWNSQREAKIWSASISRRERAPECFHTHFDHLFLPPPPQTYLALLVNREIYACKNRVPRRKSAFISRLPVSDGKREFIFAWFVASSWCIGSAMHRCGHAWFSRFLFAYSISPFPILRLFLLFSYGKIYVEEDSCSTKLDKGIINEKRWS